MFEPKIDLSGANALYWKKYLQHCWDFSAYGALCPLGHAPGALQAQRFQRGDMLALFPAC